MEGRVKQFPATARLHGAATLALTALFVGSLPAAVNDLRLTEVRPSAGEVEVTHLGSTSFTTTSSLPFCHRFNYFSVIPAHTTFGPGESTPS